MSWWLVRVPKNITLPGHFGQHDSLFSTRIAGITADSRGKSCRNYMAFGSSLGPGYPRFNGLAPRCWTGKYKPSSSSAFSNPVGYHILSLLEHSSGTMPAAIRSAEFRTKLHTLCLKTQRQAEELQVSGRGVAVSQLGVGRARRALKESQARLEQQQSSWSSQLPVGRADPGAGSQPDDLEENQLKRSSVKSP